MFKTLTMNPYISEFKSAINRTNKLGLKVPNITFCDKEYLNNSNIQIIQKLLYQLNLKPDELLNKCFRIHGDLKEPLELLFKSEIYFTIGYVNIYESEHFKISEGDIINLLENKASSSLCAHAWLTLPSMEVVDFTFATTYLMLSNEFNGEMHVLAKHADSFVQGMKYHPMLVGTDFLFKIGAVNGSPTWK